MTQASPADPNLDWLRKTAKQRLGELRSGDPDASWHWALLFGRNDLADMIRLKSGVT